MRITNRGSDLMVIRHVVGCNSTNKSRRITKIWRTAILRPNMKVTRRINDLGGSQVTTCRGRGILWLPPAVCCV